MTEGLQFQGGSRPLHHKQGYPIPQLWRIAHFYFWVKKMSDHNDEVHRRYNEEGKKKHKMGFKFWAAHIFMAWVILVALGGPTCPTPGPCTLSAIDHVNCLVLHTWDSVHPIPKAEVQRLYRHETDLERLGLTVKGKGIKPFPNFHPTRLQTQFDTPLHLLYLYYFWTRCT